jgi:hypothetical protein
VGRQRPLESPSGMGETPRLQAKPSGGLRPGLFPWLYRARRAFVGFSRRGAQNPSPSGEGDSIEPVRAMQEREARLITPGAERRFVTVAAGPNIARLNLHTQSAVRM